MPKSLKRPRIPNVKKPSALNGGSNDEAKKQEDIENITSVIKKGAEKTLFTDTDNVFPMLYGYKDPDGVLHKDFEVRDITGRDEEAVHKADIKSNGARVVSTLLARCVTRIGTVEASKVGQQKWLEIIRSLYVGDQDYMMLKLRAYSIGRELSADHVCPNPECKAKLKTTKDVDEIEVKEFVTDEIDFELPRGFKDKKGTVNQTGTMRLPTGLDREILMPLARTNLARAETVMLTRLMKFDDGYPVDDDVTAGLTIRDREYLTTLQKEFYFGLNLDLEIICDSCGETFKGTLNATNFL